MSDVKKLRKALKALLHYAELNTCMHSETHRGGSIWEICSSCGKRWADDQGGKPAAAHDWPKAISDARDILIDKKSK